MFSSDDAHVKYIHNFNVKDRNVKSNIRSTLFLASISQ